MHHHLPTLFPAQVLNTLHRKRAARSSLLRIVYLLDTPSHDSPDLQFDWAGTNCASSSSNSTTLTSPEPPPMSVRSGIAPVQTYFAPATPRSRKSTAVMLLERLERARVPSLAQQSHPPALARCTTAFLASALQAGVELKQERTERASRPFAAGGKVAGLAQRLDGARDILALLRCSRHQRCSTHHRRWRSQALFLGSPDVLFCMRRFCRRRQTCGPAKQEDGTSVAAGASSALSERFAQQGSHVVVVLHGSAAGGERGGLAGIKTAPAPMLALPPPLHCRWGRLALCVTGFAAGGQHGGLGQQADGTSVPAGACHPRERREDAVQVPKRCAFAKVSFGVGGRPPFALAHVPSPACFPRVLLHVKTHSTAGGVRTACAAAIKDAFRSRVSRERFRYLAAAGKSTRLRRRPGKRMSSGFSGTVQRMFCRRRQSLPLALRPMQTDGLGHLGTLLEYFAVGDMRAVSRCCPEQRQTLP
ncbi:hypothetical protein MKEN_00718200 [Mycena kentingensis (nom. inval.)]|nr:hypothetical protein MKEN_00718200 [Mycena kentingensis (nom. inval.)]